MRCEEAIELISAQLDGELSPDEERELSKHLAQCESCRAIEREFAVLGDIIAEEVAVTPPLELMSSVMANLPPRKKPKPVVWLSWKRWAASAAAIALVALAAWRLPEFVVPSLSTDTAVSADAPQQAKGSLENTTTGDTIIPEAAVPPVPSQDPADEETSVTYSLSPNETAAKMDLKQSLSENATASLPPPSSTQTADLGTGTEAAGSTPAPEVEIAPYSLFSGRSSVTATGIANHEEAEEEDEILPQTQSEGEQDLLVKAEDLEDITDVDQPQYFGVLTLTEAYVPQGLTGYVQENGDTWYYLNVGDFQALVNTLTQRSIDFLLEDSGQRVSHTRPYGLVIVTGN